MQESNQSNQAWLRSLMADWQLIADAAFSDLVLWVPKRTKLHSFAHARPSTAATLFYRDITGTVARTDWQKTIDQAWTTGKPVVAPTLTEFSGNASRISAYPVFEPDRAADSTPIAVITRHTNLGESRYPNKLQLNFVACAEQLLEMVSAGKFPIRESGSATRRGAPRVTDGLIRLDKSGRVLFASPNALSMFNRSGLEGELEGRLLAEAVSALLPATKHVDEGLPLILTGKGAWRTDIELPELTIAVRSIPISENDERVGAAVCQRLWQHRRDRRCDRPGRGAHRRARGEHQLRIHSAGAAARGDPRLRRGVDRLPHPRWPCAHPDRFGPGHAAGGGRPRQAAGGVRQLRLER